MPHQTAGINTGTQGMVLRCVGNAAQDKIEVDGGRASKQKVVLGTHTSDGEQNYLMLAEVMLPTQDSETDASGYDEESHEVGGYGAAAGKVQVSQQSG